MTVHGGDRYVVCYGGGNVPTSLLNSKHLFPCAYYSCKLNPAEWNYTIWNKELLAVKVVFKVWWHHLEGLGTRSVHGLSEPGGP